MSTARAQPVFTYPRSLHDCTRPRIVRGLEGAIVACDCVDVCALRPWPTVPAPPFVDVDEFDALSDILEAST